MASLAVLLVTIFDLPTLITLIGCSIVKTLRRALLIALAVAVIATVVKALMIPDGVMIEVLLLRLLGQIIVASVVFSFANKRRQKKIEDSLLLVINEEGSHG